MRYCKECVNCAPIHRQSKALEPTVAFAAREPTSAFAALELTATSAAQEPRLLLPEIAAETTAATLPRLHEVAPLLPLSPKSQLLPLPPKSQDCCCHCRLRAQLLLAVARELRLPPPDCCCHRRANLVYLRAGFIRVCAS